MNQRVGTSAMRAAQVTIALLLLSGPIMSGAAPVFFGPTPYLSAADIPAMFYAGGPVFLEDFQDLALDGGITASAGAPIGPGGLTDSVDADDGTIDGSGTLGRSFFSGGGSTGITFTFAAPVTAAGIVWTDGAGTTTFEAFGAGLVSLGTIGPAAIADAFVTGETGEDSFFGVQDLSGIVAIKISNTSGGIEVDHLQYGDAFVGGPGPGPSGVPEPTTLLLLSLGLAGLGFARKRLH